MLKFMTFFSVLRFAGFLILGIVILMFLYFYVGFPSKSNKTEYGMTWSKTYADYLGIDEHQGLRAALAEFHFSEVRIPAYWTELEPQQHQWTWAWLDTQLQIIKNSGAKAIVAVGVKQPRWPECWVPKWVSSLSGADRHRARMDYVRAVLARYADHTEVMAWQVENEADLSFGNCDEDPRATVKEEMDLVRAFEASRDRAVRRPIFTTESGELSTWLGYVRHVDGIGVSVYRTVQAPWGLFHYPIFPWYYERHAWLLKPWMPHVYVSEFQMEPWVNVGIVQAPIGEQQRVFSLDQMKNNFIYASRIHLPSVHFWGVEWWYWMKTQKGHPEYWDAAKEFLK